MARAALGSKEPRSETLSSQGTEHRVVWGCLCHGSARLPGVVLGSEKYSPRLRPGSLQPGPLTNHPPSLPGIPRHDRDTRTPGRPQGCSRRLWLFGTWESGGTRAEGCCPGEEELGTRRPRLLGPCAHPPPPQRTHERSGQVRPSLRAVGAFCPSWERGQGGEVSSNRQHNEGGQGRAKKVGSRVKRPRAGSSLQMARCWESPQPHSSPETKAGGCEVWQFGLQVLVSITHPGQPSASLTRPRPLGEGGGRPSSHLSVCPGHLKEACHVGPLVPEAGGGGVEGVGSRGTCPQAGRGRGRWLRTGREDDGKGYDSC